MEVSLLPDEERFTLERRWFSLGKRSDWDFEEGQTYLHKPSRTPEWLAENGWCIDHVDIKQSTIDGAGRGLFVKRNLGVGTVLAPAPLQIFKDRKIFQKTQPEQLYVNYCLQAANSKMLCKSMPSNHLCLIFILTDPH
jgi:hypothetical protein